MLTLAQALQYNKALIKTNQQSTKQIKNWYAQGYYLCSEGLWHNSDGSRKYCTAY
jgi:hypothetical protein